MTLRDCIATALAILTLVASTACTRHEAAPEPRTEPAITSAERYTQLCAQYRSAFHAPASNSVIEITTSDRQRLTGTVATITAELLVLNERGRQRFFNRQYLAPESQTSVLASVYAEVMASNTIASDAAAAELKGARDREAARVAVAVREEPPLQVVEKTRLERVEELKATPAMMSAAEKAARQDVLKALLKVSSATSLGVSNMKYSDIVIEANTALEFQLTQLKLERHKKFAICAASAMNYYAKAKSEWDSYLKYDWMREKEQTLMTRDELMQLQKDGVDVDMRHFTLTENSADMYYVPFQEALSLLWAGARVYVDQMKADISAE